jgi:hypothetical protein
MNGQPMYVPPKPQARTGRPDPVQNPLNRIGKRKIDDNLLVLQIMNLE